MRADADNWVVNAAVSSCVVLAFAGIFVLRAVGLPELVPYVDPAVVLTIVLLSLGVPVRMAWGALMALLNRAPSQAVVTRVVELLDEGLAELPVQERFVRVIEPGRSRHVLAHVVLPADFPVDGLPQLDAMRDKAYEVLSRDHKGTLLDILFTSDRKWGRSRLRRRAGSPAELTAHSTREVHGRHLHQPRDRVQVVKLDA